MTFPLGLDPDQDGSVTDPHLRALSTLLENCAAVQGEKCAIRYWVYDVVESGEFTSWVGEASASDAELTW